MDEKWNKYPSCMLKVLNPFPFSSSWLSPFSPQNAAIVPLSDEYTLPIHVQGKGWHFLNSKKLFKKISLVDPIYLRIYIRNDAINTLEAF